MFYINHQENLLCSDDKSILEKFYTNIKELPNITAQEYKENSEKYQLENDILINIENTQEYLILQQEKSNILEIESIKNELAKLDIKTIRALREPSLISQDNNNTWVEYYQEQINTLRSRLQELEDSI